MKSFNNLKIKQKFQVVLSLCFLIIGLFLFFYFPVKEKSELTDSLFEKGKAIAQMVAKTSSASLVFDDASSVTSLLKAFEEMKDVDFAIVLKKDGSKFAVYNEEKYVAQQANVNKLIAQREGLLSIEKHIEAPDKSDILKKATKFIHDSYRKSFFCDTMKVMLAGSVPPHELEGLMDAEIETYEKENRPVYEGLARVGDSLPGLGIVAAVLGIIITMGAINEGAEKVGHHVAAALVGTFLGVLLSYGFVNPLAANIAHMLESKVQDLQIIKTFILAYAKGNPPFVAAEISRRTIFLDSRPTFQELEAALRGKKDK
jgi:flagellar motor component MotA